MKTFLTAALVLAGSSLLVGCKDEKKAEPPAPVAPAPAPSAAPSAVASAAPSAAPSAGGDASLTMGKMAHCPSTVDGAKTEVKETAKGVELTVIAGAAGSPGEREIRTRAKFLAEVAKDPAGEVKHNGSGEGGGGLGRCPVVLRRTTVEVADAAGGAKITINAKDAKEVDWLKRETKQRNAELALPGAGPEAGQKHMANCPSAATGAKTTLKDLKDGVELTITGSDEKTTKEIRERATHLVAAAKLDPKDVKHTGGGSGGGSLGRCPVVLQDTTVDAKDAPNGTVVTVKPTKPADLPKLKTETKERLAHLEAK